MRSLRNLDRICPYEMHTIGVVYLRDGQVKEADILANTFGSSKYSAFLRSLFIVVLQESYFLFSTFLSGLYVVCAFHLSVLVCWENLNH